MGAGAWEDVSAEELPELLPPSELEELPLEESLSEELLLEELLPAELEELPGSEELDGVLLDTEEVVVLELPEELPPVEGVSGMVMVPPDPISSSLPAEESPFWGSSCMVSSVCWKIGSLVTFWVIGCSGAGAGGGATEETPSEDVESEDTRLLSVRKSDDVRDDRTPPLEMGNWVKAAVVSFSILLHPDSVART